ncbi:sporulation protein YqfD [Fictibacillus iocasae]|uniref:Sporulation protein YqfD n=1 Tax=Fictibacillus iocasae TaxID=2715437 RepID=A0ABW2NWW3_9BACL
MKRGWNDTLAGYVKIAVIGPGGDKFLNDCMEHRLNVWNIKRISEASFTCCISLAHVKEARAILKGSKTKIRFLEKKGTPFTLRKLWRRNGILVGLGAFFAILLFLSNMVWNINVTGANAKTEYELRKAAAAIGVKKGKLIFFLPDARQLQKKLTDQMGNVTWIGVTQRGTAYHFQVVEKELPYKPPVNGPRHLVARKEAVIHDLFVEKGQPLVRVNDSVAKGAVLVSGYIGKDKHAKLVSATGEVMGEVWYESKVEVPLTTTFSTYTGKQEDRHFISLGSLPVPVWGLSNGEFKHFTKRKDEKNIRFLKWTLPVSYVKEEYRETDGVKRDYSVKEAEKVAKQMAAEELQKKLPHGAKILEEKVWRKSRSDGKVKLTMLYLVIENIASVQPIPIQQGE